MIQQMQRPSSWVMDEVSINPNDRFKMLTFSSTLQDRLNGLLEQRKSVDLTEQEEAEMAGLLELNKILSVVNTKLAMNLWQSTTSPDSLSENVLDIAANIAIH